MNWRERCRAEIWRSLCMRSECKFGRFNFLFVYLISLFDGCSPVCCARLHAFKRYRDGEHTCFFLFSLFRWWLFFVLLCFFLFFCCCFISLMEIFSAWSVFRTSIAHRINHQHVPYCSRFVAVTMCISLTDTMIHRRICGYRFNFFSVVKQLFALVCLRLSF